MAHLKRQKVPKNWPIHRKGTAYVVRPNFNGIPILVILRDMLKVVQNRKEAKKAIHRKHILMNSKPVTDEKNSMLLFDTISLIPSKKHYQMELNEKGKFKLKEISENESNKKIVRVINKKTLKGKKTQLNLSGGMNILSDIGCKTSDSVLVNLKDKKIEKCLPLNEKVKVIIFGGKHAGEKGIIKELDMKRKMAKLDIDKKDVQVLIKQLMVIE